jgi:hypothetical protein
MQAEQEYALAEQLAEELIEGALKGLKSLGKEAITKDNLLKVILQAYNLVESKPLKEIAENYKRELKGIIPLTRFDLAWKVAEKEPDKPEKD